MPSSYVILRRSGGGLEGTGEADVLGLVESNSACTSSCHAQSGCLGKHHGRCVDGAQIMDMPLDGMELDECVYFSMGMSNMGFVFGVPLAKKLLVRTPFSSTRARAGTRWASPCERCASANTLPGRPAASW